MSNTNLGFVEPTPLDPATANVWGVTINENFTLIDSAISGNLPLDVSASVDVTLTATAGAPDQSRNIRFFLTGTLTAAITIYFPVGRTQQFSVSNQTSGNFDITIAVGAGSPSGTTVVAPQSGNALLYSDGTNITRSIDLAGIGTSTASGIVGDVLNASMTNTVATALGSFTAELIVTGTALDGTFYELTSYSQSINLAATGAGGMDTGLAPVSDFINLYAIYNPTTDTPNILAQRVSTNGSPTIYGGTHMPAGYTASCLIGIWPTDASRNFAFGVQKGRSISIATTIALLNGSAASYATFSLSGIVPSTAVTCSGHFYAASNTNSQAFSYLASYGAGTSAGVGEILAGGSGQGDTAVKFQSPYTDMKFLTPQVLYYRVSGTGTLLASVYVSGYSF